MLWFSDEQVDLLRHHAESEAASHTLQRGLERLLGCVCQEQWTTMVATERNEVGLSGFVKSLQTPRREVKLRPNNFPTQAKTRLEWATRRQLEIRLSELMFSHICASRVRA